MKALVATGKESASVTPPIGAFQTTHAQSVGDLRDNWAGPAEERHARSGLAERMGESAFAFNRMPVFAGGRAGVLQASLTIGAVDDPLEREADRVADAVGGMPNGSGAGTRVAISPIVASNVQRRQRRGCQQDQDDEKKLRRGPSSTATSGGPVPSSVHSVLNGRGWAPLANATRGLMESLFAHDFSNVRIHANGQAGESARQVGALAYTMGPNIVFSPGRYSPETLAGRHLLAHELAHVIQQGRGGRRPPTSETEDAAVRAATAFTLGAGRITVAGESAVGVAAAFEHQDLRESNVATQMDILFAKKGIQYNTETTFLVTVTDHSGVVLTDTWRADRVFFDPITGQLHPVEAKGGKSSTLTANQEKVLDLLQRRGGKLEVIKAAQSPPNDHGATSRGLALAKGMPPIYVVPGQVMVVSGQPLPGNFGGARDLHVSSWIEAMNQVHPDVAPGQKFIRYKDGSVDKVSPDIAATMEKESSRVEEKRKPTIGNKALLPPGVAPGDRRSVIMPKVARASVLPEVPHVGEPRQPGSEGTRLLLGRGPVPRSLVAVVPTQHATNSSSSDHSVLSHPTGPPQSAGTPPAPPHDAPHQPTEKANASGQRARLEGASKAFAIAGGILGLVDTLKRATGLGRTESPTEGGQPSHKSAWESPVAGLTAIVNAARLLPIKTLQGKVGAGLGPLGAVGGGTLDFLDRRNRGQDNVEAGAGAAAGATGGIAFSTIGGPVDTVINLSSAALITLGAPKPLTDVSTTLAQVTPSSFATSASSETARGVTNIFRGDWKALDRQVADMQRGDAGAPLQGYALLAQIIPDLLVGKDVESTFLKVGSAGKNSPVARMGSYLGDQAYRIVDQDIPEATEFAKKDLKRGGDFLGDQAYRIINKDLPEAAEFAKKDAARLAGAIQSGVKQTSDRLVAGALAPVGKAKAAFREIKQKTLTLPAQITVNVEQNVKDATEVVHVVERKLEQVERQIEQKVEEVKQFAAEVVTDPVGAGRRLLRRLW